MPSCQRGGGSHGSFSLMPRWASSGLQDDFPFEAPLLLICRYVVMDAGVRPICRLGPVNCHDVRPRQPRFGKLPVRCLIAAWFRRIFFVPMVGAATRREVRDG